MGSRFSCWEKGKERPTTSSTGMPAWKRAVLMESAVILQTHHPWHPSWKTRQWLWWSQGGGIWFLLTWMGLPCVVPANKSREWVEWGVSEMEGEVLGIARTLEAAKLGEISLGRKSKSNICCQSENKGLLSPAHTPLGAPLFWTSQGLRQRHMWERDWTERLERCWKPFTGNSLTQKLLTCSPFCSTEGQMYLWSDKRSECSRSTAWKALCRKWHNVLPHPWTGGQRKASLTVGALTSPLLTVLCRVRAWLCFSEVPDQPLFVFLDVFLQVPPQKIFLRDLTQRLGQSPSYHSDRVRPVYMFSDLLQLQLPSSLPFF